MSGGTAHGTLAVVATPLGHLGDVSPRARETLASADAILAEDTRHSRPLLQHLGIQKPLFALHAHNEVRVRDKVLEQLRLGKSLCLISDAGTPAVSDPGALLVAAVHESGFVVTCVPGPSALSAAVSVSGFGAGAGGWLFMGFLTRKGRERRTQLEQICAHPGGVVLFESPQRLANTLQELSDKTPERMACVCRELTKRFEELVRAPLFELAATFAAREVLGECTLALGPLPERASETRDAQSLSDKARALAGQGLSARDVAISLSVCLGVPHKTAYAAAHSCER